jgi:hypothetical protein
MEYYSCAVGDVVPISESSEKVQQTTDVAIVWDSSINKILCILGADTRKDYLSCHLKNGFPTCINP